MKFPLVLRARLDAAEELLRLAHSDTRIAREAADERIADLKDRIEDLGQRLGAALEAVKEAQAQHHELAMHPPTGILTGPAALSPLAGFGPKTQEAIKAMSAGLSHANRDAMIAKAFQQKAASVDDEQIAQAIYRGESVKPPTHLRS